MVQRGIHGVRGRDGRERVLEKTDAAENGTDRHVELALRSGEEEGVSQVSWKQINSWTKYINT